MKKALDFIFDFVYANRRLVLLAVGVLVLGLALYAGARALGSAINESRINKLETEKQQALKKAQAAHDQNLILQGQVFAKDEQIKDLTSRIEDSNQRVTNAHKETVSARASYDNVRSAAPRFNASDDAGRVVELGTDLHGLYPGSP